MRPHLHRWIPAFALAVFAPLAPLAAAPDNDRDDRRDERPAVRIDFGRGGASVRFDYGRPQRCEPRRVWIPGHYETRCERVWVPGCTRQEWVPPRYEWRIDPCGRRFQVLVEPGQWITVTEPGRYETREVAVWVPGYWSVERR